MSDERQHRLVHPVKVQRSACELLLLGDGTEGLAHFDAQEGSQSGLDLRDQCGFRRAQSRHQRLQQVCQLHPLFRVTLRHHRQ